MSATRSVSYTHLDVYKRQPKGFLKVIDERTIAFADFRGNKQYISTGNLLTDNRVALILVDLSLIHI